MNRFFRTPLLAVLVTGSALAGAAAQAQDWQPTQNIEYMVPAGAGAALDTAAREIRQLIDRLKLSPVPVLVSNKPGGAGMVAMGALASHPGDGHMVMTLTHSAINARLVGDVKLGPD